MQFELEKLKYLYSERIMFYRYLLYQISLNGNVHIFTREFFLEECAGVNILCIVIYILHRELDYYTPKDRCVYQEKSVAFQKCSWRQLPCLWLCGQVSFQLTWSLDYSFTHLVDLFLDVNSSLGCMGKWRDTPKNKLKCWMIPWSLWTFKFPFLFPYTMLCHLPCDFTMNSCSWSTWSTLGHGCGTHKLSEKFLRSQWNPLRREFLQTFFFFF